jgi:TolB-like protein
MSLEPGARLGPYEIERFLGAGGFGSVYRALDPRLERSVAIKVLSDEIAADAERLGRFREEARAAASLNHPHICSVYDVEHDHGVDYIVMELVDGRPLSELIPSGGLPIPTAVRYGTQIADALGHAHARGIVHGDLKARNVMVAAAGEAKIVDFGLARRVRSAGEATGTQTAVPAAPGGSVTGTPAYMAPETLRGENADRRTDIWALGVLLHEMVTGTLPFPGRTLPEMTSAILRDAPRPPPPAVPSGLSAVIRRCLAKEPGERYQAAGEVRSALETIATGQDERQPVAEGARPSRRRGQLAAVAVIAALGAGSAGAYWFLRRDDAAPAPTSLAVLPCRALAERERIEFLEVGIADSIIIALSNAAQLRVRSTSAILPYQGQDIDPREVGRALNAEYLLTCTLQPTPDRVAATVQFVRANDGSTVWGERYEVARGDLLGLRDRISERVASALRIRMTEAERERFYRRYTKNAAAYERYLQGRAALARYTRDATLTAVDHFNSALAIDPQYALAHAGLASAAAQMRIRFATPKDVQQWLDLAHREADAALRLDPELAEAHEARAAVARHTDFDWERTMEESNRALALNPSLAMPHFYRAGTLYHFGLLELADREIRLGLANDPVNRVEPPRLLGNLALIDGRFADAVSHLNEAQRLSESAVTGTYLALALYYSGKTTEAETILQGLGGTAGGPQRRAQASLASFLAARGERSRATTLINEVQADSDVDHHAAYSLGAAYAQLGDATAALRWLERAAATGFPCHVWFARDPLLAPIRNDARYQKLLVDLERRVTEFREEYGGQ